MKIVDDKLEGVRFVKTKKTSGKMHGPKFIVMHYTAGWTSHSAVHALGDRVGSRKASAHIIMDRDGSMVQMVPFDTVAWHAGPSASSGYKSINRSGIGIEIVNIGFCRKRSDGSVTLHSGTTVIPQERLDKYEWTDMVYPKVGSGSWLWMDYSDEQLNALDKLVTALLAKYPSIEYIVSHEEIDTRGWKTDPGPTFPMERYKKLLKGDREEKLIIEKVPQSSHVLVKEYTVDVPKGDVLNVRGQASPNYGILAKLEHGQRVTLKSRSKENPAWVDIRWWVDGLIKSGWVNLDYLRPFTLPSPKTALDLALEAPDPMMFVDHDHVDEGDIIASDTDKGFVWDAVVQEVNDSLKQGKLIKVRYMLDGIAHKALVREQDLIDGRHTDPTDDIEPSDVPPVVKPVAPAEEFQKIRQTTVDNLNVRGTPPDKVTGQLGEIIDQLPEGQQVIEVAKDEGWLYIHYWRVGTRMDGYIHARYVK